MTNTFGAGLLFLVNTCFDLYILVLLLRVILQWAHADFYNPIAQLILKLTRPVLDPLHLLLPNFARIDVTSIGLMLILEIIKFTIFTFISLGALHIVAILLLSLGDILKLVFNTFFFAILAQAILSWLHQGYSPVGHLLNQLTNPIMQFFRRWTPVVSGFDLSAIPALLSMQLLVILVANPIIAAGVGAALG